MNVLLLKLLLWWWILDAFYFISENVYTNAFLCTHLSNPCFHCISSLLFTFLLYFLHFRSHPFSMAFIRAHSFPIGRFLECALFLCIKKNIFLFCLLQIPQIHEGPLFCDLRSVLPWKYWFFGDKSNYRCLEVLRQGQALSCMGRLCKSMPKQSLIHEQNVQENLRPLQ